MLGHDHIPVNAQSKVPASFLQALQEHIIDFGRSEIGAPMVATEGEKVRLSGFVKTMETARHETSVGAWSCGCGDD